MELFVFLSRKLGLILLLLVIFSFFSSHLVYATNYYVDATGGSDSNSGTDQAHAWQTINKINTSVFQAADAIYLKYGQVWHESLILPSSGSNGSPITLDAYGDSTLNKPKLTALDTISGTWTLDNGSVYKITNNYNQSANVQLFEDGVRLKYFNTSKADLVAGSFYLDGTNHVLYVWTSDSANPNTHTLEFSQRPWVFYANGKSYWNINNVWATGAALSGFNFRDAAGNSNLRISNSLTNWNGLRGFDLGTDYSKSNDVIINSVSHDNIGEGFWAGNGTGLGCDGCTSFNNGKELVTKNYLTQTAGSNFTIGVDCVDCYIKNSHSYNGYYGTDAFDVELETGNTAPLRTVIENNIIDKDLTGRDNARDSGVDSVWQNNIFQGDGGNVELRVWNSSDNIHIYNNTFDQASSGFHPTIYSTGATNVKIKNNIFYNLNGAYPMLVDAGGSTGFESDFNDWYGSAVSVWQNTFYSMANWQSNTSNDLHSVSVDPLFVDAPGHNYHLNPLSPVINIGTDLGIGTDFEYNVRPQQFIPDIGAYEFTLVVVHSPAPAAENNSSSPPASSNTVSSSYVCSDSPPVGQPDLFQINRSGKSATLFFTPTNDNVQKYDVVYGFKENQELFGILSAPVTQETNNGVQSLVINALDPRTTYWFKVMAVNGCATGTWSNWLKASGVLGHQSIFYRYLPEIIKRHLP